MKEREKLIADFRRMKICHGINLYDKILELRKFEIENFWKRTLFFWGTIALIYAGFFKADLKDYQILISLIGFLFNIIFSLSIRGSKYWQEHWETIAVVYENELKFDLFKHNTQRLVRKNSKSIFTRPYRFSVSKLTMLLSDLSVILWIILWIEQLLVLLEDKKIKIEPCFQNCEIHLFSAVIIAIHIFLIGYFIAFISQGNVYHKFSNQ